MSERFGSVVDLVRAQVRRAPEQQAIAWRDEALTYQQLWDGAELVAERLRGGGVRPDDVVGLCARRSPELVVGVLGILRAGGAYLPLDTGYPAARLHYMLEQAGARLIVGHRDSAGPILGDRELVPLNDLRDADGRWAPGEPPTTAGPEPAIGPENLGYVMFTSGSTGRPKGVMQTHGALAGLVRWQLADSVAGPGDVTTQFAPISFDVSFQEIFATLASGGCLLCLDDEERRDPIRLWGLLVRHRVARLFLPYVALQTLALFADDLPDSPPALREIITAGEALRCDDRIKRLFARLSGCHLINQYGPTETHVVTRYRLPAEPASWPLLPPIGTSVAGAGLHVLGPDGVPVPPGQPGELHVSGTPVARGYIGREDLTRQRFRSTPDGTDSMYATGDVVEERDGVLHYLGRDDDQVKVNGVRVEPAEVERELLALDGVREAAVVADHGRLIGFVTGGLGADRGGASREELAARVPAHLVPSRVLVVRVLPTTPSGKIDRAKLLETAHVGDAGGAGLESICRAELGLATSAAAGSGADLRAAGVDSLAAARIAARIASEFRVLVRIDEVMAATSLEQFREVVARAPRINREAVSPPAGPLPLSAMQQQIFIDQLLAEGNQTQWAMVELDVRGPFDAARAERAVRTLTNRHAALRTRYDFGEHYLQQDFTAGADPEIVHREAAGEPEMTALRRHRATQGYDFGTVANLTVDIIRLAPEHHRLLLRVHHASADGWSFAVLCDEFAALYTDPERALTPAVQCWQLPEPDDETRKADLDYWETRLSHLAAAPALDWGAAHEQLRGEPRLRRKAVTLTIEQVASVRSWADRAHATPFAVLLAAWTAQFNASEVGVAVPFATRKTTESLSCVGLLLNTLVLPLPTQAENFCVLVGQVDGEVAAAAAHHSTALPELLARLGVQRVPGRPPLARMIVTLQPPGPRSWVLGPDGPEATLILDLDMPEPTGFDLVLNLDDRGDRIIGWIDYDTEALDGTRVDALVAGWKKTLEQPIP
ncbi:non-ribosomal peptide synthetase [Couchioplanes caeruleus]|uniref:AMP-dependent ligase n=2 Tax=Couchioplanes caeruleus TaxID=56438 RepID=A0A1K0FSL0_9ACTN|nr:non-ribosomal peptide synthetase [Couchioplanes caeruleus]OJF15761.1 AMP-dependent ligase [Couchioplanes caeruleus subsp. caeruleus]ROP31268.1 amino acid adenylation domain-containing protein [Couchioplanes caeruleus]